MIGVLVIGGGNAARCAALAAHAAGASVPLLESD
jgi:succinate dehydrogenase/fumarate reductase flavoprotein subunit